MSATPPGEGEGAWGGGGPHKVSTPLLLVVKVTIKVTSKSFFKSAENRAASSPWVGGHR